MRYWLNLFVPGMALAMCAGAMAQGTTYHLGRTPSPEEIRAWDIAISADGKGLPPGRGTAVEGAILYAQKCAKGQGRRRVSQCQRSVRPDRSLALLVRRHSTRRRNGRPDSAQGSDAEPECVHSRAVGPEAEHVLRPT